MVSMKVKRESKVGRHTQKYRGQKIIRPRITITGEDLLKCGFAVGDEIVIHLDPDEQRVVIEKKRIETNGGSE